MMFEFSHRSSRRRDRGLTLVELMVALAVISVLAGIALPTVKNSLKARKLTRAATQLQSAIQEGRARSIGRGGGGGVIIERLGVEDARERGQSIQLRFAVAPPPYSGDAGAPNPFFGLNINGTPANITDDVVSLWFRGSASQLVRSAIDIQNNSFPTLINIGDIAQIGDANLPLTIERINTGPAVAGWDPVSFWNADFAVIGTLAPADVNQWVRVQLARSELNADYRRFVGDQVPFLITRAPRPAIAKPVEMPTGTAIDLTASGIGRYGNQFSPMAIEGNYLDIQSGAPNPPFTTGPRDYQVIYILFGARGEVSRIVAAQNVLGTPQLAEIPVTGDIHFLVGEAGELKTAPDDQLESNDPNPLIDEAKDGRTPLLNPESVWVTIKARNGEVITSPWIDPTDATTNLIPPPPGVPTDALREQRIQTVIGRTRTAAVESRDSGS